MVPLKRTAILLNLIRKMRSKGSWCGETHVQKAVYMLQAVAGVRTGFEFVLYKHGPFSFELRDEITSLRADDLLDLEIQPQPYGPKLIPTSQASKIEDKFPNTLKKNEEAIDFISASLQDMGVSELEKIATAVFITHRDSASEDVQMRAVKLHRLKPHIDMANARAAFEEGDKLFAKARQKHLLQ